MTKDKLPWRLVEMWPANGEYRQLHRWNITAAHLPREASRPETLIIKSFGYVYKRERIGNAWLNPVRIG